jgi:hypothetical protein
MKLEEIWSEKDLCARLALPVARTGRSRQLGNWIKGGLKFAQKSGRRYFLEQDVIDYLWSRYLKEPETVAEPSDSDGD